MLSWAQVQQRFRASRGHERPSLRGLCPSSNDHRRDTRPSSELLLARLCDPSPNPTLFHSLHEIDSPISVLPSPSPSPPQTPSRTALPSIQHPHYTPASPSSPLACTYQPCASTLAQHGRAPRRIATGHGGQRSLRGGAQGIACRGIVDPGIGVPVGQVGVVVSVRESLVKGPF